MAHRLTTQPYELALQAGSMPVNENASRRNWLIDGSFHAEKLQNWLSGASNCVLRALLPLHVPVIHNYQLSMVSRDFCPKTNLALPEQCCQHTHQKQEIFALLNSCPSGRSRGENEKMEPILLAEASHGDASSDPNRACPGVAGCLQAHNRHRQTRTTSAC